MPWGTNWGIAWGTTGAGPSPPQASVTQWGIPYDTLTSAQRLAYLDAIRFTHFMRVLVSVYDQNEALVGLLNGNVVGGQVDFDSTSDIDRTLSIKMVDPHQKFVFDSMGDIYAKNFVGVVYGVFVPAIQRWVDAPLFFGPVSHYVRNGHDVSIEAAGKESLLMDPVKQAPITDPADARVVSYIRSVAAAHGETKFELGQGNGRTTPNSFNFDAARAREMGTWKFLRDLADSINHRLFYDGRGYLVMEPDSRNDPTYTFQDVDGTPSVGYDLTEVRNQVNVFGKDKSGNDTLKASVQLAASHPLSEVSLSRNGVPRTLLEIIKNDNDLTVEDATAKAKRFLEKHSRAVIDVSFDSLVVPHLELGTPAKLRTDAFDADFDLKTFTIPLTSSDLMSVGYNKQMKVAEFRYKVRKHFKKKKPRHHGKSRRTTG